MSTENSPPSHPLEIDVQSVHAMLSRGDDFLLLDCRESSEYAHVKIDQATLIPMSELADRAGELEQHRQKEVVVHCHHGGRSLRVVQWLVAQGYSNARSMAGGIDRWAIEIDPSLPRY